MSGSSYGHRAHARLARVSLISLLTSAFTVAGVHSADSATAAEPAETPAVQMQDFSPDDFVDRAGLLPEDLVAAVRRDLGLSAQEYLARAATAHRAAAVVDSLGSAVRSAWLVEDDLHVAVDTQADATAARAAGAEVHVGDGLTDALAAAQAQDKLAYIDREAGRVVPIDADLEGEPVGRSGLTAQSSWRGGDGFAVSDLLMDYRCSTGFAGTSADGATRILTAGHCGSAEDGLFTSPVRALDLPQAVVTSPELGDTWAEHIGDPVGEFVTDSFAFGDGKDAGLIDVTAEDWDVRPEVTSPAASGDAAGVQVLDSIDPIAGAVACSSGTTSGWTCGHVLAANTSAKVSGSDVTGFLFDACVLPGDSGGAIMTGPYALGINSGSTWQSADCSTGAVSPASTGTDVSLGYAVSGGTDSIEKLYGDEWDLLVHVGAPTITSPDDQATVGATPTMSGTVAAAAGATVEISIDGAAPLETTVGPEGRWSVPVTEPLEPGSHSFEATASHTAVTSDTAATGDTVTGTFTVAPVASLNPTWPRAGDTTTTKRPTFTGTGQPGATVELRVGSDVRATTTVSKDGSWAITPESHLAAGRFDVVLTQQVDEESSSVTVRQVGLKPGAPVITSPRPGEALDATHRISGLAAPGATVSLHLNPSDETAAEADGGDARVRAGDDGAWAVELAGPMPDGSQTVVATQSVDGLRSEPSAAVSFAVDQRVGTTRSGGTLKGFAGRDSVTGTGSATSSLLWAWGVAVLLIAAAVVAGTAWRRRRTSG
ncbi:S1 family peptidase [Haloactinopolyspora sp.]|uniref:S1 family peptidase n=1 Tax=Haloactinopolyspora sp. TaxID=1966353 RepID=UPI0026274DB6|nr:S1 family peptidase [Haloactinopolyspora sp.]